MAITRYQSGSKRGAGSNPFTTDAVTTANGMFLVHVAWYGSATSVTITDNKGNGTFPQVRSTTPFTLDANGKVALFCVPAGIGGAGHTFTVTGVGGDLSGGASCFFVNYTSGNTLAIDQDVAGVSDTTEPYATNTTGTTTTANEKLVAFYGTYNNATESPSWNSPFATVVYLNNGATDFTGGIADGDVSSTGTYQAQLTTGGVTDEAVSFIVTIKEVAPPVVADPPPRAKRRAVSPRTGGPFLAPARLGRGILIPKPPTAPATLTCAAASYAITGNDAGLTYFRPPVTGMAQPQPKTLGYPARRVLPGFPMLGVGILVAAPVARSLTLSCAQASYTIAGNAATLTTARTLSAAQVSYALSGQACTFAVTMPAAVGTYAITGQAATLTRSLRVTLAQGSLAITGQAVSPKAARLLTAAQATYTIAGQALGLSVSVPCSSGSYAINRQAAALARALRLTGAQASFSWTGQAATLTYSPVGSHTITADAGTFAITGQAMSPKASRRLTAAAGTLAITGGAMSPLVTRRLAAVVGTYAVSGQAVAPTRALRLVASNGALTVAGQAATLTFTPAGSHTLSADAGAYTVTRNAAGVLAARRLVASLGTLTLTGEPANLNHGQPPLSAATGTYDVDGGVLDFTASRALVAGVGSLVVTGRAATFRYSAANILIAPPPRYITRRRSRRTSRSR